jgi:hypothetical protein
MLRPVLRRRYALIVLLSLSCRAEPVALFTCDCEYLTDRDQPGRVEVDVCAGASAAPQVAEDCARGQGVGKVQGCSCKKLADSPCSGPGCAGR